MTKFTITTSSDPDFMEAARFFPSLHAIIITAYTKYQPQRTTLAQAKAIATLETAGQPFFENLCCDMQQNLEEIMKALGFSPTRLKEMLQHTAADGKIIYPNVKLRHQDIKRALADSYKDGVHSQFAKLILACGWGMFRMPGITIVDYFEGGHQQNWRDCAYSPIIQTVMFLQVFDSLMEEAKNDFQLAASMWHAGNTQKTITDYGKQAVKTYNRLISSGHRVH